MFSAASAEFFPHYNKFESYTLKMPAGIELASESYDSTTGRLRLVVDSEKSDFDLALTTGYDSATKALLFRGTMSAPSSISGSREAISFSPATDERIRDFLTNFRDAYNDGNGNTANWSWFLGSYDEDKALFFPENNTFGDIVIWNHNDSEPYLLTIDLSYTSTEPLTANIQNLPEANIMADHHKVLENETGAQIDKENGSVRYTRSATNSVNLTTRFTLPNMQEGWKVYRSSYGSEEELMSVDQLNGQPVYELTWPTRGQNGEFVNESSYSLLCRDAEGVARAAYHLSITLVQGEKKPWPEYNESKNNQKITPVPAERLQVEEFGFFDGIFSTYKNGILTQKIDNDKLIAVEADQLRNAELRITVTPPTGAVCYAVQSTGDQIIFGPDRGYYSEPDASERYSVDDSSEREWQYFYFSDIPYNNEQSAYYRNALGYSGDLGGMIPLIFWYDSFEATQPMSVEYFAVMADTVKIQSRTNILNNVTEVPSEMANRPFIAIAGVNGKSYAFFAQMYPTGEQSRYYELNLVDENGNVVPLTALKAERYTVYIPLPDVRLSENTAFYVSHFTADGETVKDLYSFDNPNPKLRLYPAPNGMGLYFDVSSLSPFVLTWEEETPAAPVPTATPVPTDSLPQTGDSFPMELFLLLCGASLLTACLLLRRKNQF